MFKTIVMTAMTIYLFVSSSLYAESDYYGKIGVGFVDDKTVEGSNFGTRQYRFEEGAGFQLAIGRDLEIMSIEGEYAYSTADLEKVKKADGNITVIHHGYQDIHSLMINALYHPLYEEKFSPYIGLGIGYSYVVWDSSNLNVDDSVLIFSSQLMLGASYEITEDIALNMELKSKMFPGYKISGLGKVDFDTHGELFLSLIYRFTP